jgi:hypothetical protein
LETKVPIVGYCRLGGPDGLRMTRAAFSVMIKFSDLVDDFNALVDTVGMQAPLENAETKIINLCTLIK